VIRGFARPCRRARQRIFREVDRSLSLDERFLLDEHLIVCRDCEDLYERMLGLEEALVRMPEPSEEGLDVEAAVAAIGRAIDEPGAPAVLRHPRWSRAASVAAAALVLGALVTWFVREDGEPQVAQAPPLVHFGTDVEEPVEPDAAAVARAVRANLLASTGGNWDAASSSADALVLAFEERSRELLLWPLPRIAETLLADSDPRVACAAARYLGLRGDRISALRLADALAREDVAPAAVRALGDLGPRGVPALAQALHAPEYADVALAELQRIGGPEAAAAIERALLASPSLFAEAEVLLDALAATGPAAVEFLVRLRQGDVVADGNPLSWLAKVDGGDDELVRLLQEWTARQPIEALLEAVALLQPIAAQPWVEERIQELRYRDLALQSLVTWEGTAPVESLLRLDAAGRVPDDALLWALEELADHDVQRLTSYARELLSARDAITAGRYLELLLVSGDARVAPALGPFVYSDLLSIGERQLAALAIGEIGTEEDALRLLRGLEQLEHTGSGEERLLAACLITVHRMLGEPGVTEAMAGLSPGATRQVQMALAGVGNGAAGAIGLSRVARALDGALTKNPKNRNPSL